MIKFNLQSEDISPAAPFKKYQIFPVEEDGDLLGPLLTVHRKQTTPLNSTKCFCVPFKGDQLNMAVFSGIKEKVTCPVQTC